MGWLQEDRALPTARSTCLVVKMSRFCMSLFWGWVTQMVWLQLVEEDLQSLEAKFRLADLLPKYTSLMASVIAAANADRYISVS